MVVGWVTVAKDAECRLTSNHHFEGCSEIPRPMNNCPFVRDAINTVERVSLVAVATNVEWYQCLSIVSGSDDGE
jgi:hypothetical protein